MHGGNRANPRARPVFGDGDGSRQCSPTPVSVSQEKVFIFVDLRPIFAKPGRREGAFARLSKSNRPIFFIVGVEEFDFGAFCPRRRVASKSHSKDSFENIPG